LTERELLEVARQHRYELTPRVLKRWRMEGLIPRPRQIHALGKRGSGSLYPPESVDQLLAVCELRDRERRFDELRFRLWWEGRWVEAEALRRSLLNLIDHYV